jgi:hypothetical protein
MDLQSISLSLRLLQVAQPPRDWAPASRLFNQTCSDRQIDENHVQTIIQTLFSSEQEKPVVSMPNLLVEILSW